MTIDIFPSVAEITGARLPSHPIDGRSILPLMKAEPGARSPHEALFFYWNNNIEAVRSGRWKLHFPHSYATLGDGKGGMGGTPEKYRTASVGLSLYDLEADVAETTDVAAAYPEVVSRLSSLGRSFDSELRAQSRPCSTR
jgi:arylsulfatase A-like enzyme